MTKNQHYMKDEINQMTRGVIKLLGSSKFTVCLIGLFVFQALWIAFSFRYSMIYDEYYHYGIAEYLSHQWHPFIANQPTQLDEFGALTRAPWLLYHFILSFPLRLVALCTDHFAARVITIRIVNIALCSLGLFIYYRQVRFLKLNKAAINIALFVFILIPVVPFIAATVNYDNLIFPLVAALLYFGVKIIVKDKLHINELLAYSTIGLMGALTKSSFLPILSVTTLFVIVHILTKKEINFKKIYKSVNTRKDKVITAALIILFIFLSFMFIERYVVNIYHYHAISPNCLSQISKERCMSNYVEARAIDMEKEKSYAGIPMQIPEYSVSWYGRMIGTWFTTGANTEGKFGTKNGQPLPVAYNTVFVLSIVSMIVICMNYRSLVRSRGFTMLLIISILYILSIFYVNISEYFKYYRMVAVQGRYILLVLPVIIVAAAISMNTLLKNRGKIKVMLVVIISILLLNGGGLTAHIIRSDETWNWNNSLVRSVNNSARNILSPFIKEYWY